jgi:hypothetical protein
MSSKVAVLEIRIPWATLLAAGEGRLWLGCIYTEPIVDNVIVRLVCIFQIVFIEFNVVEVEITEAVLKSGFSLLAFGLCG